MLEIAAKVTPRSKRVSVTLEGDRLKVHVTAPPADGEANAAVCEAVAKALDLRRSAVSILRGHTSRDKLLGIEGVGLEEVAARLGQPRLL